MNESISKGTSKGCPQGSVCGPIFWDLCVETLLEEMLNLEEVRDIIAYADDVMILVEGDSRKEIERNINKFLKKADLWCTKNKLKISLHKTNYILLKGSLTRNTVVKIGNTPISRVDCLRYLGVWLDEKQK